MLINGKANGVRARTACVFSWVDKALSKRESTASSTAPGSVPGPSSFEGPCAPILTLFAGLTPMRPQCSMIPATALKVYPVGVPKSVEIVGSVGGPRRTTHQGSRKIKWLRTIKSAAFAMRRSRVRYPSSPPGPSNLLFKQAFFLSGIADSAHGPTQSSQRPANSRVGRRLRKQRWQTGKPIRVVWECA